MNDPLQDIPLFATWDEYVATVEPRMALSFSRATALVWLSTVVGNRLILRGIPGAMLRYPQIWVLLVAPPWRGKTTAMNLLIQALPPAREWWDRERKEEVKLPYSYTLSGSPEGFYSLFAVAKGEGILITKDEFVHILSASRRNTYLAEWRQFLLELMPHSRFSRVLRRETIYIDDVFCPFISTITPGNLLRYAGMEEVRTGFLTRFLPIVPSPESISASPTMETEEYITHFASFAEELRDAFPPRTSLYATEGAQRIYTAEEKKFLAWVEAQEEEIRPWYGRAWEFVPRAATLIAAARRKYFVEEDEMERALALLPMVKEGIEAVYTHLGEGDIAADAERVLFYLRQQGGEARRSEVIRKFRWAPKKVEEVKRHLLDAGYILCENGKPEEKGRPYEIWLLSPDAFLQEN